MRDFKKLKVWQKAHQLVLDVYRDTITFPREERFGLTAQLRKSVMSTPANIAEGCGRFGDRELAHFISIASGSATETEYHLIVARDLGYLHPDIHAQRDQQVNEVKKMLASFHRTLSG